MKRFFGNLIDILCLTSCGVFACIVTKTLPDAIVAELSRKAWVGIGVGLLLFIIFPRLTKLVWNVVYCVTSIVLIAALLQWATMGVLMPPALKAVVEPYTLPALIGGGYYYELASFGLLWLLGALCSHGFWRVTITALGSYTVWIILALVFHLGCQMWLNSPEPIGDPRVHQAFVEYPWLSAAVPGCFTLCYAVLMSMFDALFVGWPAKKKAEQAPSPAASPAPAATKPAPAAKSETKPAAPAPADRPQAK